MIKSGVATHSTTEGSLHAFSEFLRDKFGPIAVDDKSVTFLGHVVHKLLPMEWSESLEALIEELSLLRAKERVPILKCCHCRTRCVWMAGSWNNRIRA